MVPLLANPFSPNSPPVRPGIDSASGPVDTRLLVAGLRARQTEIIGNVVNDSLERMAEERDRRAEERAEREVEKDRLESIALRERTDAESAVRAHEQRRADAQRRASAGDPDASLEADRAESAAAQSRLDAKRAGVDLLV